MTDSKRIHMYIGNVIARANKSESVAVLRFWEQFQGFFQGIEFSAQCLDAVEVRKYQLSLESKNLIAALAKAIEYSGSFNAYLQECIHNETLSIDCNISIAVEVDKGVLASREAYEVATLFMQQVIIAANIFQPGAVQILNASFTGEGSRLYEMQSFDSKIYYGAFRALQDNNWNKRHSLEFKAVWSWLEHAETSQTHTAIKGINKVLFTLLKVAEQRNVLGARTALMVLYQLEVLLDCHNRKDPNRLRSRIHMILGEIIESEEFINGLYEVQRGLFLGDQPVRRPPLIGHDARAEMSQQIEQHDSDVEVGAAMVLVLIRELIAHNATEFKFSEQYECQ